LELPARSQTVEALLGVDIASLVEQHRVWLMSGKRHPAQATTRLLYGTPTTTLSELVEGCAGRLRGRLLMHA
jgi:hypothetical protein